MASTWTGPAARREVSNRAPANTGRPLRAPSTSRSIPVNTSGPSAIARDRVTQHSALSNVAVFLSNLALLDLDLHEDWPGISVSTFSSRDGGQEQKQRIHSVEWSLYHLFALWDPARTRAVCTRFGYLATSADWALDRICSRYTRLSTRSNLSTCAPPYCEASSKRRRMAS